MFYKDWMDAIRDLPDDVRLDIYEAVIEYATTGNIKGLKPMANIAFNFIKTTIDRDMETYRSVVERNRINGGKGGRPKKETQNNPENPVGFLGTQRNPKNLDSDSVNDNDSGSDKNESPPPDFDSSVMETIDACSSRLKSQGEAFFFLARNTVRGKREINSLDELHAYINQFADELKAKGEGLKNSRDFQNHFINWIKKPSNGSTKKETGGVYKA